MQNPDQDLYLEAEMSEDFLKLNRISEEEEEQDDEEEEFSFVCGVENESLIAAEDAFAGGQIKPVFPLFNRDLLFSGGGDMNSLHENLPMRPPVRKLFVETNEDHSPMTSSAAGDEEISGPYCEWSNRKAVEAASPEVCKKSNSTGFSKIWRLKEFSGRCNSDGRDAFVFFNNGHAPLQPPPPPATEEKTDQSAAKVVRKVKKSTKTAAVSAHEVYLRRKAKEEERRRPSYLPYRPELMGFFTNVNGGLTKNVHPF